MALAERIFYTLPELAIRWGKSEDDLIHIAAAGSLPLSISYEGHISGLPVLSCQGFLSLYPHDAAKFLLGTDSVVEISRFYDPDCDPNSPRKHFSPITLPENYENLEDAVQNAVPTKLKKTRADLVVMARAVTRLEAEQPELLAQRDPAGTTASNEEIDRMDSQDRQKQGDYYPEHKPLDADCGATLAIDFIPYPKAMKILREKWQATPEELAIWIFLGPETGGIAAYRNANELNPPPRFYFAYYQCEEDYRSLLMYCWFRQDDIDQFVPTERYITGAALIERWSKQPDIPPEAFIRAKIAESRLLDMHPTFGGTVATFGEDIGHYPPLAAGLFAMSHIERIEAEDGLDSASVLANSDVEPDHYAPREVGGMELKRSAVLSERQVPEPISPIPITPEGRVLCGDKELAAYANRAPGTIKRWRGADKSWWSKGPTGKPTTTSTKFDEWRLSKKKNHDAK
jgi:hypothetical protein